MKVGCVLQARMGSSRLPGKSLMPLGGPSLLEHCLVRARRIAPAVVATSTEPEDQAIAAECARLEAPCFRGSHHNVLERFCQAGAAHGFEVICRLTGDNPLVPPERVRSGVELLLGSGSDYVRSRGSEAGTHAEVVTLAALQKSLELTSELDHLEHVTLFVAERPDLFKIAYLDVTEPEMPLRWTLDTAEDYRFLNGVFGRVAAPLELTLEQARAMAP